MGETVLVTGASGLLGSLFAAAIAAREGRRVALLARSVAGMDAAFGRLVSEVAALPGPLAATKLQATPVLLEAAPGKVHEAVAALIPELREHGVNEVVHCAGSTDYFDAPELKAANIDLTRALLAAARALAVRRFVFVSTAFSSGFRDGPIREAPHTTIPPPAPEAIDPTPYTWSKRAAEAFVTRAGVPYLILRPGIVIGDSRDGRYEGRPTGLYQFWGAARRLLGSGEAPRRLHVVAPRIPPPFVHQDAVQAAFLAAFRRPPPVGAGAGEVLHVVSRGEPTGGLPTVRDLWEQWLARASAARGAGATPSEVLYYDRAEDIPRADLDRRARLLLELTAVNTAIASHRWRFETPGLDALRAAGLDFADATLASVGRCLDAFLSR